MKKKHENGLLQRLILSVLVVLAAAALLTGVTMAWFTNQYQLSSIGKIHPLSYISILAPGDAEIQAIDLSYDKSEVKDGRVELQRPFVIRSGTQYYDLCIAHTTNTSGLSISLYEATEDGSGENAGPPLAGITEKGTPYYWYKIGGDNATNLFDEGGYLNKLTTQKDPILADKEHDAHRETFQLTEEIFYEHVQKNAEPLYWVKTACNGEKRTPDDDNYYTNYILEITWDETDKETDILYVIAQTGNNS